LRLIDGSSIESVVTVAYTPSLIILAWLQRHEVLSDMPPPSSK
jgi:hypothetical protein